MAGIEEKKPDLSGYDDEAIIGAIQRHQDQNATDSKLYKALVEENARRSVKRLDPDKTIALLIFTAKGDEFISYKDVAAASGIDFSKVRYQVGKHLDAILTLCDQRKWPLLTCLCVKQSEKKTGALSGDSLKGFIGAARRLKHHVTDEEKFLIDCQQECRKWARTL